uniref:Receptor-like protein kinase At3g47110 n=1 Tax=Nicotiana tabacum TaxID=4097 RepID=A0A1S3X172_TOBAC|nr:PREDICTED: putative receptor-like protein kinase At3g47110 [Nicotiana tabacum]
MWDNKLEGPLTRQVENLTMLNILDLGVNNLTGAFPDEIANRISGPFPNGLCKLSNLGLLNLSQNQMQENIPSFLGNVTSLREVYLDSNNFTDGIPSSLWNLKDILKLNLSSNIFNGTLPLEVGNLKAAIILDLSWNQISSNIPKTIGSLQKLAQLSLAHNRIEGSIPEIFGELINLEALDLSYNNMSSVIPKSLEALKQLDSFNVSFNRLYGEIPNGGPFADIPYQSFVSNEGLCGNPKMHVQDCYGKSKKRIVIFIVIVSSVIALVGLALVIVFVLMRRHDKTIKADDEWLPDVAQQRFSYYDLQRATQDFNGNNLLGSRSLVLFPKEH